MKATTSHSLDLHCFQLTFAFVLRGILRQFAYLTALLLSPAIVLFTAGCGAVKPAAFQAFSQSVQQLREGTDKALEVNQSMASNRFMLEAIRTTTAGDSSKVEQLRLPIDRTKPFSWTGDKAPLFLKAEQFRDGANRAMNVLASYAELLVRLSSPELLPQDTFDKMASDLNANAFDAALAITGKPPDSAGVAIFSTIAVQVAREYLESKRRSKLVEALTANQPTIETFSQHMRRGVETAATHAAQEYDEASQELFRKMVTSTGPAPEGDRRAAIQALIDLDRKYIQQLSTFQSLYTAFGQVTNAHAELIKAASNPELSLSSIVTLLEEGKRLEGIYDKSLSVNRVKTAQAIADKAAAQADALEAEAESAQLRADRAQAELVKAKAEAQADPSDSNKQVRFTELQKKAEQLKEEAEKKKKKALEARESADTAQKEASEIKKQLPS
jgi:hypothetical protein